MEDQIDGEISNLNSLNNSQGSIVNISDTQDNNADDIEIIDLVDEDLQDSVVNISDNESRESIGDQNEGRGELDYILVQKTMYKRKLPPVIDSEDEGPNYNNHEQKRMRKHTRKSTPVRINTEAGASTSKLKPTVISSATNVVLNSSPISKSTAVAQPCSNNNGSAARISRIDNGIKRKQTLRSTSDPATNNRTSPVLLQELLPSPKCLNLSQANNSDPVNTHTSRVGYNVYNPNVNKVRTGLRPIIIDGSNVAVEHGLSTGTRDYSVAGLEMCMEYFVKRGHTVKTFIPRYRLLRHNSSNYQRLQELESQAKITCTPSRKVGGETICSYNNRYIVQTAAEFGGIVVTNNNYYDLVQENEAWRDTIERRLLKFTWIGDCLMFPLDPLGRHGPSLDRFLRF